MGFVPENANVWMEIPVRDLEAAVAFYGAVTGSELTIDTTGPNPMAVFPVGDPATGASGHLYPGTPAAEGQGPTVHLAAEGTVEEALERARAAGGTVVSPAIDIPAGRFAYLRDPDGNSIGVFEKT